MTKENTTPAMREEIHQRIEAFKKRARAVWSTERLPDELLDEIIEAFRDDPEFWGAAQ